jgi:hypothetical protein
VLEVRTITGSWRFDTGKCSEVIEDTAEDERHEGGDDASRYRKKKGGEKDKIEVAPG